MRETDPLHLDDVLGVSKSKVPHLPDVWLVFGIAIQTSNPSEVVFAAIIIVGRWVVSPYYHPSRYFPSPYGLLVLGMGGCETTEISHRQGRGFHFLPLTIE